MIEPFEAGQVREGVISYGLSSYGYDIRVSPEFKVFTNVHNAIVDPKHFDDLTNKPLLYGGTRPGVWKFVMADGTLMYDSATSEDLIGDNRYAMTHCLHNAIQ